MSNAASYVWKALVQTFASVCKERRIPKDTIIVISFLLVLVSQNAIMQNVFLLPDFFSSQVSTELKNCKQLL